MASGLTILLLGCWLAGRSGVSGGGADWSPLGQTSAPATICLDNTGPEETSMTLLEEMSTSTHPNSTESGGSESMTEASDRSRATSIGVTAAVIILLLLLLVAFVCVRKTRARRGSALRPSSTSPMVALKAPAHQDPTCISIDEGKQLQTPEPDPGTDGLTYAELDGRALQGKRGGSAPAPEPVQTSTYAAINVSRGALE